MLLSRRVWERRRSLISSRPSAAGLLKTPIHMISQAKKGLMSLLRKQIHTYNVLLCFSG